MELQPRPYWQGPPAFSMDTGFGFDADTLRRARMTEELLVEARNNGLQRARNPVPASAPVLPPAISNGIGIDHGIGFDVTGLSSGAVAPLARPQPYLQPGFVETAGAINMPPVIDRSDLWGNASRLNSTLSSPVSQPRREASGGTSLDPMAASMAIADAAANVLPLTQGQQVQAPAPRVAVAPHMQPGFAETGGAVDIPNVSGGGPGTSTAKGAENIARQAAKRSGGSGFVQGLDSFLTNPAQSVGSASERGMRSASAALYRSGMPGLAGMAKNLAPVARWAAPAAAVGGTFVLPAITGAMEGNETAGAGGAVLQGGSALAGAAIGQALIPIPVVGAAIGSMAGNAIGGGLAAGAASAVEKAQQGDTGFMGGIGRALDPFVDTAFEKEQKAVMQQMNSPAMQQIQEQARTREAQARAQQAQQVLMQSYMQVI